MQWYINLLIQAHIQIRGITIRTGDLFTDSPRKSFFFKKRILGEAFDDLSALMSISLMMPIYPNQVSYFSSRLPVVWRWPSPSLHHGWPLWWNFYSRHVSRELGLEYFWIIKSVIKKVADRIKSINYIDPDNQKYLLWPMLMKYFLVLAKRIWWQAEDFA